MEWSLFAIDSGGLSLSVWAGSQTTPALIHLPLRCSALPQRRGEEHPDIRTAGQPDSRTAGREPALIWQFKDPNPNPLPRGEGVTTEYRRGAAPGFLPLAVMRRRVAQGRADQGARMFEPAGRVCAHPARHEQRSVPVAQRRDDASGSPFFCLLFFGEAKKSESAAGARPGLPRERTEFIQ